MPKNLVIVHGGGPTAVINASLYGAIREAKRQPGIGRILAAIGGTGGLLRERLFDLGRLPDDRLELLLSSPASAIGTSRDELTPEHYAAMPGIFTKHDIGYVLMNGGNGTMDACGKINAACSGKGVRVMGIPKTMDNDVAMTDHSPGFPSAARYLAGSVAELCADVASLPIHVAVLEALGRNAGWVTAASALARDGFGAGPDLVYPPERPYNEDEFLSDVQKLIDAKRCGVVVVSEGLKNADGTPIVKPVFQTGRSTYFGDVGAHLAGRITQKLGYKSRSEKPGVLCRASIAWQSRVDREEAILAGGLAAKAAAEGETGKMVAFKRVSTRPYRVEPHLVDVAEVMLHEKILPDEFINAVGNGVTDAYLEWCRPLLGDPLPELLSLRDPKYGGMMA